MSNAVETLMRRNLTEVFGEHDETRRRRTISEIMTEDVVFSDHDGRHIGHEAMNAAVASLQGRFPDFVFTEQTPPQTLTDAGRLRWGFGPPGAPPVVAGMDVVTLRDGKIAALYVFLDAKP